MSTLPNAIDTPGITDALARYNATKRPFVQAEYDKLVEFIRLDMANMTETPNNFTIINDYDQLDLSFVLYDFRILNTVTIICKKLEGILTDKGYFAEVRPYQPDPSNLRNMHIAYTISAANPPLFY